MVNTRGRELAPPYPAALLIVGGQWSSPLVRSGPVPLIHPETRIGRLASNDIILADPAVSRQHALVRWSNGGYVLEDLGSGSGTLLDGQVILAPTLLRPGQRLRLGTTELQFVAVRPDAASDQATANQAATDEASRSEGSSATQTVGRSALGPGETLMPADALAGAVRRALAPAVTRWLVEQRPKWYWRVGALGLIAYLAAWQILQSTGNIHLVPLVILLASALVPVTFVVFCWEQGAFVDLAPTVLGRGFVGGATLGLLIAAIVEPVVVPGSGFGAWLMVGVAEETAKAVIVYWLLSGRRFGRLLGEFDGLVLGAAVGMGFAALETAGYGFSSFLGGFLTAYNAGLSQGAAGGAAAGFALTAGLQTMVSELNLRMALALFGHGVWTAMVGAALGQERAGERLRLTAGVWTAYGLAVLLHALWDANAAHLALDLLDGVVGLVLLGFFLREGIARARQGDAAPPPALAGALARYLLTLWQRSRRPVARAMAFAAAATNIPAAAGDTAGFAPAATAACSHCRAGLPPAAQFCPRCGARVQTSEAGAEAARA